jgi:hypothetical protein
LDCNCNPPANIVIIPQLRKFCLHFLLEQPGKYIFVVYLCRCDWLYGTYLGCFGGFMVGYKAVAMGQVFTLG